MASQHKYYALVADNLEALHRHREHLEEALRNPDLPPEERKRLEEELLSAKHSEILVQEKLELEEAEGGEEDEKGSGGASGSAGSGGGKGGGSKGKGEKGDSGDEEGEGDGGFAGTDITALLFFSADHDFVDIMREEVNEASFGNAADVLLTDSVGAATIMFDSAEAMAYVQEPYLPPQRGAGYDQGAFLPAIEEHAVARGATSLTLRVHPSAVDLYRRRHGYEVLSNQGKKTVRLVQMRKFLFKPQSKPECT